ncbi:MAG: tRNA (guanosine(37)-N1)-methyltransferase TrmD [Candidatus Polarisedimenticolaceae bacterium]|nr:tRNA (guanosine(37)-N1)-methyltransferase TrmD [Candidatus Polarisedimenticolaceae bacterium]
MRFDVISLMPEMFSALTEQGVSGRAVTRGLVELNHWNPRDYTDDVHRTVDDRPYGGGPGMVMKVKPLQAAIKAAKLASPNAQVLYMSPQGRRLDQEGVRYLSQQRTNGVILLAGRYEGIDERIIDRYVDEEWSIGDYVLSGGELAAMVLIDSVIRTLPGVLGDAESAEQDSFSDGLLDCPHYTRPEMIENMAVPPALLGGNHKAIRCWRLQQALGRTWLRRPDLLQERELTAEEQNLLDDFIRIRAETRRDEE